MKSKGFTLIEILITTAIILILTAIVVPIYKGSQGQLALSRAANKLAQDIRRAQEMAMAAKECGVCGGAVPAGGYGVYFETNDWPADQIKEYTALIYADTSNNPPERYDSADQTMETIALEKEVKIKMVEDTSFVPTRKKFSVNFKPPDPITNLIRWDPGGDDVLVGDLLITLSLRQDPTITKFIRVNKAGLIYVE